MAKTLKEAQLSTRNARSKLPLGLHWRSIDPLTHLGYRKAKRGGVWLVRWRHGTGYRQRKLGAADDALKQGTGTLSYEKVVPDALRLVEAARAATKATADGPPLTVRSALLDYIAKRDARDSRRRGRSVNSDASRRLRRHILGADARGKRGVIPGAPLADVALYVLTETDLLKWRKALPGTLKASSQQRLVSDLRAALNGAYLANRQRLDPGLPAIVRHGLKEAHGNDAEESEPVARDNQILTDGQVTRLIGAAREIDTEQEWGGDLYRAVIVLAATGARFSQIIRMRVDDCQYPQSRLMVPASRKGKGKSGSIAMPVGRDVLEALRPVTTGRPANAALLERWRHERVAASGVVGFRWQRADRGPWQSSAELTHLWHAIRDRAGMSDAIPYALRHSSIVRGIRANLPIRLVAALHDTSAVMIERHYAKWIVDGLEELAARAVVPLVPEEGDNKIIRIAREAV